MVVTVFTLIVSALLASTWLDSRGVSSDLRGAIAPRLSTAETGTELTGLWESTGELSERFAVELLPIAASLGRAADSTGTAADEAKATRENTRASAESLASLDVSVAAIRALAEQLAPMVASALGNTGDIHRNLARAEREAEATARLVEQVLRHVRGFVGDARSLRSRTKAIEAVLERIERNGKRMARADALECPENVRGCVR
jgi:hypothetical protein